LLPSVNGLGCLPRVQGVAPMEAGLALPLEKTVLVVEDNDLNRQLLEVRLEMLGYGSLTTTTGIAGVDVARKELPDLILMDIQLPDISGIEAIRRLKADDRTKAIPIVAITSFALRSEKERILASGCDAYIAKPFRGEELDALIKRYTSQRSQ